MCTTRDALLAKLDAVDDFPTLPSVVFELEVLLHDDMTRVEQMALVIEEDPSIAAAVLRVANSPVFFSSLSGRIVSITDAVVRLGTREVGRIVSSAGLIRAFAGYGRRWNPSLFWRRSLASAVAARRIAQAQRAGYMDDTESYMAGLLHDVGELILDRYFPEMYEAFMTGMTCRAEGQAEAERALWGVDHGEVGGYVLRRWNLPDVLVDAVECHGMPESAPAASQPLAQIVRAAEYMALALDPDGFAMAAQQIKRLPLWETMKIPDATVDAILDDVRHEGNPVFALAEDAV